MNTEKYTASRNTIQRNMVLSSVKKLANHPTADEVYADIVAAYPDISKATVYRNLNVLSQNGLLKKLELANSADRFDHKVFPHYHIKCGRCGLFQDVDIGYVTELDRSVSDVTGFEMKFHNIIFEGICPACKRRV